MSLQVSSLQVFQSALPRGERREQETISTIMEIFQSALPRGERHYLTEMSSQSTYFNPRSREGSDENGYEDEEQEEQFQSALPRGERLPNLDK